MPTEVGDWASSRRFCVTGGRGLLGSRVVDLLASLGAAEVVAFDAVASTAPGRNPRVRDMEGSVLDREALRSAVEECDTVFHLAALTDVGESQDQLDRFFGVNAWGTARVGQACRSARVHRVVYSSTSHVYGTPEELPIREEHPLRPQSPYAASKVAGEAAMWGFAMSADGSADILRLANLYDARSRTTTLVGRMLSAVLRGEGIRIKSFRPVRDFVPAEEAAEAFVRVAALPGASGECRVANVSSSEPCSVGDVARTLAEIARDFGLGDFVPEETGGADLSTEDEIVLDGRRLYTRLDWLPTMTLETGLRRCLMDRLGHEHGGARGS